MPKLSIITVNFNNKNGLIDTAKSVVAQTWTDYEWIIIDGGSTDGSVDIIKEYADKTDKLIYWCSEPDGGIYQGMNKGIEKANGEYCWFLNSGDYAYKNTTLTEIFANNFDENIIYGNIYVKSPSETEICNPSGFIKTKKTNIHNPVNWAYSEVIPHQASFIKRSLFGNIGMYKTIYKHANDTEFFMNAIFNHKVSTKHIDVVFAVFMYNGVSANSKLTNKIERGKILIDLFPNSFYRIITFVYIRKLITAPFIWIKLFVKRLCRLGVKQTIKYYTGKIHQKKNEDN